MGVDRINVDAPLWDQSTFLGRFSHFAWMSNPLNGLVPSKDLLAAKVESIIEVLMKCTFSLLVYCQVLVEQYRAGEEPAGTTSQQVTRAMQLYRSAFHPDTGDLQNFAGRMSFQVRVATAVPASDHLV